MPEFRQYEVIGRHVPTKNDPTPKAYRIKLFTKNETQETGVCLCKADGTACSYHCPWESAGSVSAWGCSAIAYDCADTTMINTLLTFYTRPAAEWGEKRKKYTVDCIKHQCQQMPDPGPAPAPPRRMSITV